MADRALTLSASLVLASLSLACGEKGDGTVDETGGAAGTAGTFSSGGSSNGGGGTAGGSGGSGGAGEQLTLYDFASDDGGFIFEMYTPMDPMYTNIGATSMLAFDEGEGSDGNPGRLRLDLPFDGYNQLADIQLNADQASPLDWTGKTLRARVMVESGFSPHEDAPGGAYLFAKTTTGYVWAKGLDQNLLPSAFGTWVTLAFALDTGVMQNTMFNPAQVLAFGIQFYTGNPMIADPMPPTAAVIYVDEFTIQ